MMVMADYGEVSVRLLRGSDNQFHRVALFEPHSGRQAHTLELSGPCLEYFLKIGSLMFNCARGRSLPERQAVSVVHHSQQYDFGFAKAGKTSALQQGVTSIP